MRTAVLDRPTLSEVHQAALALLPRTVLLRGKAPAGPRWTTHVETPESVTAYLAEHPEANIGCRCGTGLAVLDIDLRHQGYEALAVLEANHGRLPITPRVLTGGGGEHLYFREPFPLRSLELLPGLEVKAHGCQVVAPPSIHPDTGRHYCWDPARSLATTPIAVLPAEIAQLARQHPAAAGDHTGLADRDPLHRIPARRYVPVLTGREIDRHGYVRCPFHNGGAERTPSLYAHPEGGWKCFGCGAGGRIYQLAGLLAGWTLPLDRHARAVLRAELRDIFGVTS